MRRSERVPSAGAAVALGRCPEENDLDLRQSAMRGVMWSVIEHSGARVTTTLVFVVLARLLEPEAFGVVALASVAVAFLGIFQDQGLGHAIVQRKELPAVHVDTAFWLNVGAGATLTVLTLLGAHPLASLLREPNVAPVLQALSITLLLSGLSSTPAAVLRRELRFGPLATRTLVSTLIAGVVGLAMAFAGLGIWALVGQTLVQAAAACVLLWRVSSWRPHLKFSGTAFRELLGFGAKVTGSNVLNFVSRRSDDLLVGTVLGPIALGLYSVSYRVLTLLTDLFIRSISSVTLPTFAKLQGDPARMRRGLHSATRMSSLIAFPVFFGVSALAPEVVQVVFGPNWLATIPVVRVLALIGALHAMFYFNSNIMVAAGKPGWSLALNAMNAVVNVAGFIIALRMGWGILGVATAYVVRGYVISPVALLVLKRLIGLRLRTYFRQIVPAAVATVVMVAAMLLVTMTLAPNLAAPLRLAVAVVGGGIVYLGMIALVARQQWREAAAYLRLLKGARQGAPALDGSQAA